MSERLANLMVRHFNERERERERERETIFDNFSISKMATLMPARKHHADDVGAFKTFSRRIKNVSIPLQCLT